MNTLRKEKVTMKLEKVHFLAEIKRLELAFNVKTNSKLNDQSLELYYDQVKNFSHDEFKLVVDWIMHHNKTFPKIADFVDARKEIKQTANRLASRLLKLDPMQTTKEDRIRNQREVIETAEAYEVIFKDEILTEKCFSNRFTGQRHHQPEPKIKRTWSKKDTIMTCIFCPQCDVEIAKLKDNLNQKSEVL